MTKEDISFFHRPEWIARANQVLKSYMGCFLCGKTPVVIHHNNSDSYGSFEEYLTLKDCFVLCHNHHLWWHKNSKKYHLILCKSCRLHWTSDGSGLCFPCRKDPDWFLSNRGIENNLQFYDLRKKGGEEKDG
jgi:hypothetical protein